MNINESRSKKIVAIRSDDPRFNLNDGTVVYPRAMLHVLSGCPSQVRAEIQWAFANGYLKAVANVPERELIFSGLTK